MPLFIRQLRLACCYHAYFSLRSPSVRLDDLRRKFRFLLSVLSREDLTSYFESAIQARIHPENMVEWQEIPFFSVGGAGTHYPRGSSSGLSQNQVPIQEDPLSILSSEAQVGMYGSWFDIRDLEGFLQEKGARFLTGPPMEPRRGISNQAAVNVSSLIKSEDFRPCFGF